MAPKQESDGSVNIGAVAVDVAVDGDVNGNVNDNGSSACGCLAIDRFGTMAGGRRLVDDL